MSATDADLELLRKALGPIRSRQRSLDSWPSFPGLTFLEIRELHSDRGTLLALVDCLERELERMRQ